MNELKEWAELMDYTMVTDSNGHVFIGETFQVMEFDSLKEAEQYLKEGEKLQIREVTKW